MKRIFIEPIQFDTLNTSWPTELKAWSCQALTAEPQRIEVMVIEHTKLKPLPLDPELLKQLPPDDDYSEEETTSRAVPYIQSTTVKK